MDPEVLDSELVLPPDTLALLQEFRQEEAQRVEEFNKLAQEADDNFKGKDIESFKEDWQLSQFWYDKKTASTLASALVSNADSDTIIVIISAPSVYAAMTHMDLPQSMTLQKNVYLLEIDPRFKVLAGDNFVLYDFNKPFENLPLHLKGKCHRFLADPPFLNEDCQTKTAMTVRWLQEKSSAKNRVISCTGERMAPLIKKLYPGTKITDFLPQHERGLSNEFRCYADFEDRWKFSA